MNLFYAERARNADGFTRAFTRFAVAWAAVVSACAAAERPRPALQQWVLEEDLRIGSEEAPAYAFSDIQHVMGSPGGRIYVAELTEVRIFDSAGRHVRTAGREGRGPGEFRQLQRLGWAGDTLVAIDGIPVRITFLTADGATISTAEVRSEHRGPLLVPGGARGVLRDGTLLMSPAVWTSHSDSFPSLPLYRVAIDGRPAGTLGRISRRQGSVHAASGQVSISLGHPLPADDLVDVTPDGRGVLIVERPSASRPHDAHYRVIRIDLAGDTVFAKRYEYDPLPVSREAADSISRRMGATVRGLPRTGSLADAIADALDLSSHQPPITAMVVATDGTIWLRREALGRDPVPWTVLAANGDPLATIDLPAGLVLHHVTERSALGVIRGEDDVPQVVRYRIERGRR